MVFAKVSHSFILMRKGSYSAGLTLHGDVNKTGE